MSDNPSRATVGESILVAGGRLLNADGVQEADVLVIDGRIEMIAKEIEPPTGVPVVDASGKLVMPGGVDVHTHFDGKFMGASTADDFHTGGLCAAAGGITSHVDMCIPDPDEPLNAAIDRWHDKARDRAVIDYGFHAAILNTSPYDFDELAALVERGCPSFKLFLAYPDLALDDDTLLDILDSCRQLGAMPVVHAESLSMVKRLTDDLLRENKRHPRWHPASRPPIAEAEATGRIIDMAQVASTPIYIAHVTCRESLARLEAARSRGQEVYAETEPHYLTLTEDVFDAPHAEAARFLCSPPLRSEPDQKALISALADGLLTGVASDHCPISDADRQRIGGEDFSVTPNGLGTIEYLRQVLWTTAVEPGMISAERFVELTATAPAQTFGLRRKGRIAVGFDGDLSVWDPEVENVAAKATSHSGLDYCALEGLELRGQTSCTIRRGTVLWDGSEFVAEPGSGRFVHRVGRGA